MAHLYIRHDVPVTPRITPFVTPSSSTERWGAAWAWGFFRSGSWGRTTTIGHALSYLKSNAPILGPFFAPEPIPDLAMLNTRSVDE